MKQPIYTAFLGKHLYVFGLLLISILSCSTDKETAELSDEMSNADESLKTISTTQFNNLELNIEDSKPTQIAELISVNGRVDVPPENIAMVSLPVNGFVKTLTHNVLPGKYVAKGSVLAMTQSMEIVQMQQDYLEKFTQQNYLQQELERQKILAAEDATARRKLQEAENNFNVNKAMLSAFAAKLKIVGISLTRLQQGTIITALPVVAPMSAYVKAVKVHIGTNFTPTDVLFELVGTKHLHIELKVFEKDAFKLKEGQTVVFNDSKIGGRAEGKVFLVGKTFEDDTRAVNVHVHLSDEKTEQRLIPGQYLNATIQTDNRTVNTLPEAAILREDGGAFVYVLHKQDKQQVVFKKILVETGAMQADRIEIISPVSLQNVVTKQVAFLAGVGAVEE